jgi:hypothetical protein
LLGIKGERRGLLNDPVLGRKLRHEYRIKVLPVEG